MKALSILVASVALLSFAAPAHAGEFGLGNAIGPSKEKKAQATANWASEKYDVHVKAQDVTVTKVHTSILALLPGAGTTWTASVVVGANTVELNCSTHDQAGDAITCSEAAAVKTADAK